MNYKDLKFKTIGQAKKETKLSYLGGINISSKLIKNKKVSGTYTYIIYLAPANLSGYNVCSHSTPECRLGCLNTSGRAGMDILSNHGVIQKCRIEKTKLLHENSDYFMQWMISEILHYEQKAEKDGYSYSIRLNGTSDIDWSNIYYLGQNIFEYFPNVSFYDYTKDFNKFTNKPKNYHLTFSYTGHNENSKQSIQLLEKGYNIAVVFDLNKNEQLPLSFNGYKVVNGDLTDYRVDDGKGVVVGLRFKHIANKENETKVKNSCFVIKPNDNRCQCTKEDSNLKSLTSIN